MQREHDGGKEGGRALYDSAVVLRDLELLLLGLVTFLKIDFVNLHRVNWRNPHTNNHQTSHEPLQA